MEENIGIYLKMHGLGPKVNVVIDTLITPTPSELDSEANMLERILFQSVPRATYESLFQAMKQRFIDQVVKTRVSSLREDDDPLVVIYHPDGDIEFADFGEDIEPEIEELEPPENEGLDR